MAYTLIPQTSKAPPLMHFPLAQRYLQAGYALRRATWTGYDGEHELAWITYSGGLYIYHTADAQRVVLATDVKAADLRAWDWTLLSPSCAISALADCACATGSALFSLPGFPEYEDEAVALFDVTAPNGRMGLFGCALPPGDWRKRATDECDCADTGGGGGTDPITCPDGTHLEFGICVPDDPLGCPDCPDDPGKPGVDDTGGGGTGGTGGDTGGTGGTDGGSGSGGGGTGGGGGGTTGGGSGGGGRRRPRAAPQATLDLAVVQIDTDCIPDASAKVSASYSVTFTLHSNDGDAGTLWFYTIRAAGRIFNSGTMGDGDTKVHTIEPSVAPGQDFPISVNVHKPVHNGGNATATERARMVDICCPDSDPDSFWNIVTRSCDACPPELPNYCAATRTCLAACETDEAWNPTTCACDPCPAAGTPVGDPYCAAGNMLCQDETDGMCGTTPVCMEDLGTCP